MAFTPPEKPAYGHPCNGCGLCCIAVQCPLSEQLFGPRDLCPALTRYGNAYGCGVIAEPAKFFAPTGREKLDTAIPKALAYLLGAGRGCDSEGDDEVVTETQRVALREGLDMDLGRAAWNILRVARFTVRKPWGPA